MKVETRVKSLLKQEGSIRDSVVEIVNLITSLSDFVVVKSPVELAKSRVIGLRLQRECERILSIVYESRKSVALLMQAYTHASFKGVSRALQDIMDDLSFIQSDLEVISSIGVSFFSSDNRQASFANLVHAHDRLIRNVISLVSDENDLKLIGKHVLRPAKVAKQSKSLKKASVKKKTTKKTIKKSAKKIVKDSRKKSKKGSAKKKKSVKKRR